MRFALLVAPWLLVAGNPPVDFTVATIGVTDEPQRLDLADLDGDGDVDLFVVERVDNDTAMLQVLLNEHGHFSPGWRDTESAFAADDWDVWDVDLADTDNDGDRDVIYVVPMGSPRQRFNLGDGHFGPTTYVPTFSFKFENELADMDGDGKVDLVYYEPDMFNDIYFGTMKGNGNGFFGWDTSTELALVWGMETRRRIALGDVTGDGLRDAAFTSAGGLSLFRGKPPAPGSTLPGWLLPVWVYDEACADVASVDLDGDGRLDLVASVPPLDSVVVLLATHTGWFSDPQLYPAGKAPRAIATADFDLDGRPDVAVANASSGAVNVLHGTGNGGFSGPVQHRVGRLPNDVEAADLDGDGDTDLAVACATAGHVALLYNAKL